MLSLFLSFCGPINVAETSKEDGDLKAAGITKPKVDAASWRLCPKDILCWHWKSSIRAQEEQADGHPYLASPSSEIGTKLRDWAVGQAGGSCSSRAALSSNDSKTRYIKVANNFFRILDPFLQGDQSARGLGYVDISSVSYGGYPETELMTTYPSP